MAVDKKISALAAAGVADGTELVPVVQGGVNVKMTAQALADLGRLADVSITTSGNTDLTKALHLNRLVICSNASPITLGWPTDAVGLQTGSDTLIVRNDGPGTVTVQAAAVAPGTVVALDGGASFAVPVGAVLAANRTGVNTLTQIDRAASIDGTFAANSDGLLPTQKAVKTYVDAAVVAGSGAPTTADYLVKTANGGLSAERVVTDSASVTADWSTAGQVTFNVVGTSTSTTAPTDWKDSVVVATTANITLSGEQTIDGVLTSASRVLVKDQTTGANNGIYVSAAGAWSRATDADGAGELSTGTLVFVESGTANGNQLFALTTAGTITIGTTAQTWQSVNLPVNVFVGKTVSGTTYTNVLSDGGKRLNLTNASTKTVTVAPQSSVAMPANSEIEVYNAGAGTATIAPGSGVTINATGLTLAQYTVGKLKKRANPNTWDFTTGGSGSGTVTLTGDVTGSGTGSFAATIANDAVTNAKAANMATATIKGRSTAGTGDPEDLTATQATALLNAMVGDSGSGGTKGLVPAPAAGDAASGKFLKADGTFAVPAGSGQAAIQFKDEGSNVGTSGAITAIDIVGAGATASVAGTTLTLTISGGGGGGIAAASAVYAARNFL